MTDNHDTPILPFLARFATPLPEPTIGTIPYNSDQQIVQAPVTGSCADATDAQRQMTRVTKVRNETTDDE
jgi:hypothetical protein